MKLSKKTVELLKNFSTINQGMLFLPGTEIKTISIMKNGFARAKIEETIPQRFAIYSLPEFLGVLSLFSDPDIAFQDKFLTITEGNNSIKYFYAAESIIVAPPEGKDIQLPTADYALQLTYNEIDRINKTAAIMKFDTIGISKDGVRAFNAKTSDSTSNVFKMTTSVNTNEDTEVRIKIDNLKMIDGSYDIKIATAGLAQFTNVTDSSLVYFIPLEK